MKRSERATPSPLSHLTRREYDVLREIATGKSNAAIAQSLVITKHAVEAHVSAIFAKLDLPGKRTSQPPRDGHAPLPAETGHPPNLTANGMSTSRREHPRGSAVVLNQRESVRVPVGRRRRGLGLACVLVVVAGE